ncbi:hypothetical protein [Spirosoma litoris]
MLESHSLTEEQIQDNKEIQDGLLILTRLPLPSKKNCDCSHCKRLNQISGQLLDNPDEAYGPNIIPQLGGKIATKVHR